MDSEGRLWTQADLEQYLQVSRKTLYTYRQLGLPAITLPGGAVRFDPEEVKAWIKAQQEKKAQE